MTSTTPEELLLRVEFDDPPEADADGKALYSRVYAENGFPLRLRVQHTLLHPDSLNPHWASYDEETGILTFTLTNGSAAYRLRPSRTPCLLIGHRIDAGPAAPADPAPSEAAP